MVLLWALLTQIIDHRTCFNQLPVYTKAKGVSRMVLTPVLTAAENGVNTCINSC